LKEATVRLQLPLQPTTSNSAALSGFAHYPDLKSRYPECHQALPGLLPSCFAGRLDYSLTFRK
jgi:hypothetical protein